MNGFLGQRLLRGIDILFIYIRMRVAHFIVTMSFQGERKFGEAIDQDFDQDSDRFDSRPVSGFRKIASSGRQSDDLDGDELDREDDFSDFPPTVRSFELPQIQSPELTAPSPSPSWWNNLVTKLKARISTPPPVLTPKEFIPSDEQDLLTTIELEESSLTMYRKIVENRRALLKSEMSAGRTESELASSEDHRLSPEITRAWEERVREKERLIENLKVQLTTKRLDRAFQKTVRPVR